MPKAKKAAKEESYGSSKPYARASASGRTVTKWTQKEKQAALNAVLDQVSDGIDFQAVYAKMYPEGSTRTVKIVSPPARGRKLTRF